MSLYLVLRLWWHETAKPWLKENWFYVVCFPAGIVALWVAATGRTRKLTVTSTELSEADAVRSEAEKEVLVEEAKAREERDTAVQEIRQEHVSRVDAVVSEQRSGAVRQPEGEELTDLLLKTGRDVR